jgi:tetratricopeptide (TPR) repeat protein
MTGPVRQQKGSIAAPRQENLLSPLAVCIIAVALITGVFAIYSPALSFQFILDDHHFVNDPRLQSPGHVWEYFTNYVWAQVVGGPPSFYRPVFVLWLRLNFILAGMSSWGWHLLSLAKHVSAAVLLGVLAWKLLRDRVGALLAGTLFALHPAQTESVAWVTVPDPLMAVAVLGSLLLYLGYRDRASADDHAHAEKSKRRSHKQLHATSQSWSSAWWLIASATACLAAQLAKETAIVLPAVFFAAALIIPVGRPARVKAAHGQGFAAQLASAFRESLPFLGVTLVYLLLRLNALGERFSPLTQHLPWTTVLLSWPATLWFYGKVLFWPVVPRAFADPSLADTFSLHGVLWPGLGVCCSIAVMAWAFQWAWRKARRDLPSREGVGVERALLWGTLILVLPILLTLNLNGLNPGDFLHGRYTYLPLAGLMLLLATGWHLVSKGRVVLLFVAATLTVAFGVLTVKQESAWKDDLTVFTVAHQNAPNNAPVAQSLARAQVQVALGLDEQGRCDEAVPIFKQAIEQYPEDWFAWAGLGECFVQLKDLPKAEQSLRRASELSHEPRVSEEWQQVRSMMGGWNSAPPK